ncbi:hypothetical protein F2Q68_00032674 [Brassica cretica]|uniref:Uncharacterized protein n=1 Tax=Brassica cretica TaxID=69181 RepID=A0A8S9GJY1_BRACR|nr:hypothetical protein F2Q68_00032674 [Brassica cretica]
MGGVNIQDDVIIDKSIRRSLDSRASVVKRYVADIGKSWPVLIVCGGLVPLFQSPYSRLYIPQEALMKTPKELESIGQSSILCALICTFLRDNKDTLVDQDKVGRSKSDADQAT